MRQGCPVVAHRATLAEKGSTQSGEHDVDEGEEKIRVGLPARSRPGGIDVAMRHEHDQELTTVARGMQDLLDGISGQPVLWVQRWDEYQRLAEQLHELSQPSYYVVRGRVEQQFPSFLWA
jgi:hypothetical protein